LRSWRGKPDAYANADADAYAYLSARRISRRGAGSVDGR
jgi:hypothetical protein